MKKLNGQPLRGPRGEQVLRKLTARGLSDSEIARKLDMFAGSVYKARKRFGIPPGSSPVEGARRGARATLAGARRGGYAAPICRVREKRRIDAYLRWGHPLPGPAWEAVLDRLEKAGGPLTSSDLALRTGYSWYPGTHDSTIRRVLRGLLALGMVRLAGRRCTRHGRTPEYALAGCALEMAERRKREGDLS